MSLNKKMIVLINVKRRGKDKTTTKPVVGSGQWALFVGISTFNKYVHSVNEEK
jgi:hypothetical protein